MDLSSKQQLSSSREIPVMGLGTWQLKNNTAATIELALKLGYRLIDTSGDYGTQPGIAEGIKRSGLAREEIYLVSKVEETDDSYEAVISNLRELETDYADLMLIHRPPLYGAGEELWEGLMRAKREGLVKDIGVSNYPVKLIKKLIESTGEAPVVNQIEWSPFGFSVDMRVFCDDNEIVIQAYSPLTRAERLDNQILVDLASSYGKSPAQMLIRWNLQHKILPIPKANQEEHLIENLEVFDFVISDEDMDVFDSLNEGYSSLGSLPYA